MSGADVTVLVLSMLTIAGMGWYFFAPARAASPSWARRTEDRGDGQGRLQAGPYPCTPGRPAGDRIRSAGVRGCTNRVVFADLGVSAGLPAHTKTTVRLRPDRAGTFGLPAA